MELHKLDPGPKSGKKKLVVCSLAMCGDFSNVSYLVKLICNLQLLTSCFLLTSLASNSGRVSLASRCNAFVSTSFWGRFLRPCLFFVVLLLLFRACQLGS